MTRFLQVAIALLIGFTANAQDAKKAKELLDEVSDKVRSYENIVIEFKYTLNNPKENINQESKGNVALQGNLYNLNFMGVTKIFDGKKTYTIVPEDEEITIANFDANDENAISPNKMLTFFKTGYKYNWDILQNVKGRKIQYVKLTPYSSKDQRKDILIGIDVQTKHIYTVIEMGKKWNKNYFNC